jgi:hypothetical protein
LRASAIPIGRQSSAPWPLEGKPTGHFLAETAISARERTRGR